MTNCSDMDLQAWSVKNWERIPEADRKRCLDHLQVALLATPEGQQALALWAVQVKQARDIGSDDMQFHFGGGIWVRNRLRDVLGDEKLPGVIYRDHGMVRNWDDYYIGALHALVLRETAPAEPAPAASVAPPEAKADDPNSVEFWEKAIARLDALVTPPAWTPLDREQIKGVAETLKPEVREIFWAGWNFALNQAAIVADGRNNAVAAAIRAMRR